MIAEGVLAVVIVTSLSVAILFTLFAGLQRIPWRHALIIGIGSAVVLGMSSYAASPEGRSIDPSALVLLGAIAGGCVVRSYERGMVQRRAMIDRIVRLPST